MENNIIEMHDTWLAVNSIVGCTNGCKYCFLQATGDNLNKPKVLVTPEEAITKLFKSKYYNSTIPVCLLPNTDPFLNQNNIKYVTALIDHLATKEVKNPLILITKCFIPDEFIAKINFLMQKGMQFVIYLSYSGLGKKYEPNINYDDIKSNFKRLHENNIPIVHYFRPFIPENSDPKKIEEILNFVSQYTKVSVTTGLALRKDFIDKIDFWDVTKDRKEECLKAISLWPEQAYNYLFEDYHHSQNNFQTNTCALAETLKRPSPGYYGTTECQKYNHCSKEQRALCASFKNQNLDIKEKLHNLLVRLNIDTEHIEVIIEDNGILIKNADIKAGDASYLTFALGKKVNIDKKRDDDNVFNSSFTNSKYLIIK